MCRARAGRVGGGQGGAAGGGGGRRCLRSLLVEGVSYRRLLDRLEREIPHEEEEEEEDDCRHDRDDAGHAPRPHGGHRGARQGRVHEGRERNAILRRARVVAGGPQQSLGIEVDIDQRRCRRRRLRWRSAAMAAAGGGGGAGGGDGGGGDGPSTTFVAITGGTTSAARRKPAPRLTFWPPPRRNPDKLASGDERREFHIHREARAEATPRRRLLAVDRHLHLLDGDFFFFAFFEAGDDVQLVGERFWWRRRRRTRCSCPPP